MCGASESNAQVRIGTPLAIPDEEEEEGDCPEHEEDDAGNRKRGSE